MAIVLSWLALAIGSCTVYLVADDWACLERVMDHGPDWSFNPALPGRLFYRPLTQDVYYRAMNAGFGARPIPYHLVNLLLHGLNVLLVVRLGRRLSAREEAGLWAGLLFIANPGSFLIVNFVAGIQEIAMMNFALLAVTWYLAAEGTSPVAGPGAAPSLAAASAGRGPWLRVLGPAGYTLSLFCKESMIWLPVWLWLHDLVVNGVPGRGGRSLQSRVSRHLPYDLVLAAYLVLRMIFMPPPQAGKYLFSFSGVMDRLEKYMRVAAEGLGLPGIESLSGWFFYLGIFLAALLLTAAWSLRRRRVSSVAVLGLGWYLLGILLFLALPGRFYKYYISAALIGLFWSAGTGLELGFARLDRSRPGLGRAVFIAGLIAFLGVSGWRHVREHREDYFMNLARATRIIHRELKTLYPSFPPGARIILFTDFRVNRDPSHFGLRAFYHRPDLQVFLDEQAYVIERKGGVFTLTPRPDFDFHAVHGFAYTRKNGFMEVWIGTDGSVPFTAQVPGG